MAEDRERMFEQALKQHLRRDAASADAEACLDAETLAAYQEKMLAAPDMELVEVHLAECIRCREILHHLETAELAAESVENDATEVSDAASESKVGRRLVTEIPRKKIRLGWVVPAGALAAGLLLLVGLRDFRAARQSKPSSEPVQVAENRREDGSTRGYSADAPQAVEKRKGDVKADKDLKDGKSERQTAALRDEGDAEKSPISSAAATLQSQSSKNARPAAPPPAPPPAPLASPDSGFANEPSRGEGSGSGAATGSNKPAALSAKKESPKPAPPNAQMDVVENKPTAADGQSQTKTQGAVAGNIGAVSQQVEVVTGAPPTVNETVSVEGVRSYENSSLELKGRNIVSLSMLQSGAASAQFGKSVWRFGEHGSIAHSNDGGKTWKSQAAAVAVKLTSGSAPGKNVCWIAGAAGTLLRTADGGKHWQLVITPISGDLGGVAARDKQHATIWDDGSHLRYETADGGATWKPVNAP
jgi:hypothetical protein